AFQFGKLGFDGKNLSVLVLRRFACIYEVFQHGHSVACDINNCDIKMKRQKHFTIPKALLKRLRGNSSSERLLHRLHAVALVSGGLSASEVGQIYGDSTRAVAYWVTQYRKNGYER